MIRVTIEVVPHGDDSRAEVIDTVTIGQMERWDNDPDGLRGYGVCHGDMRKTEHGKLSYVHHTRSDGALKLVALACEALG